MLCVSPIDGHEKPLEMMKSDPKSEAFP